MAYPVLCTNESDRWGRYPGGKGRKFRILDENGSIANGPPKKNRKKWNRRLKKERAWMIQIWASF